MLVVAFWMLFENVFFSCITYSLTLVASRWSSEAFEHVFPRMKMGTSCSYRSLHSQGIAQRLPVGPIRASFAPINSSASDTCLKPKIP